MKSDFIWMDGELVPYDKATVHFLTPTLHYGMGVFEGIRCYLTPDGPAVFRLREHLIRFMESTHILGIQDFPYSLDDLRRAVHQTIKANGYTECYIRPLMYLEGPMGLNIDHSRPRVGIAVWQWGNYLGHGTGDQGVHMMVSSFTRLHPNINMTKSKVAGNYVNSMLVKTMALRSGFHEGVILDPQGYVAECCGENIFMVRKGMMYTPPLATVLEGLTRDAVMTMAMDAGIRVEEKLFTRDQLYIADEIFLTGTASEMVAVTRVDFRQIKDGQIGPITRSLMRTYDETVHGNGKHSAEWLDFPD